MAGRVEQNEGIVVSGGAFHAGSVAVGRGARAEARITGDVGRLHTLGRDELAEALQSFVAELKRHADELDDVEELLDTTRAVGEEVVKPEPNKRTVKALLAGLSEGVGSVASLITATSTLATAIAAVL